MSAGRPPAFAFLVGALLASQTLGTMATMMLPAAAPRVAETYGVSPVLIGYQVSVLAAAMLVALAFGSHLSLRWGACRVTQIALVLLSSGCLAAVLPHVAFLFVAALALGLGYGMLAPPASHLLARFTPPGRRNLVFSFKQTGVPLGGIGAAVVTPPVALLWGWQWALAGVAALMLALAGALEAGRAAWDGDRDPRAPVAANPFAGIATVWASPPLRLLSLSGGCFVMVQICLSTYTVALFVEEMRFGLVEAGIVLTASQAGGVAGRVAWGWLADLARNCYTVLAALAAVMAAACLLVPAVTPAWPLAGACALFLMLGSTASGWNGAFLAEVARLAPPERISGATGGSLVFVNFGKMVGPLAFAQALAVAQSYAAAFALLAAP
ncbi:MAG TPA: MFS transporter, partial [Burkholderiales bacterium]|nr:MFS transporter [Burkholderiales bacterium]